MGSQKTVKITIDCMATSLLFLSLLQINLIFYLLELKIQIFNLSLKMTMHYLFLKKKIIDEHQLK